MDNDERYFLVSLAEDMLEQGLSPNTVVMNLVNSMLHPMSQTEAVDIVSDAVLNLSQGKRTKRNLLTGKYRTR